jgi:hypothetical protein
MGSWTKNITNYESITLDNPFIGFYGHTNLQYKTLSEIGAVMVRNINDNDELIQ